jgi:hypothetical protein
VLAYSFPDGTAVAAWASARPELSRAHVARVAGAAADAARVPLLGPARQAFLAAAGVL